MSDTRKEEGDVYTEEHAANGSLNDVERTAAAGGGAGEEEASKDYDWQFLCTPRFIPCREELKSPPFYAKDEKISWPLAMIMGLQHCLAMMYGIITAPLVIATSAGFSANTTAYLISASSIVSAGASLIQICQFRIPFTKYVIGSGLLSVMGASFAYIPVAQQVIANLGSCTCNGSPCTVGGSCNSCSQPLEGHCLTPEEGYGAILGTILVVCWAQVALSFCSPRVIHRLFPPVVSGTCIILVGVSLVTTGFELWGGGQQCASQVLTTRVPCTGNGEVVLPFGHRYYLGLGFLVFASFVVIEMFGSPFMRNIQVIIALALGMAVASAIHVTNCEENCITNVCTNICYDILPQGVRYNNVTNTITGVPQSTYPNSTICLQNCSSECNGLICSNLRYVTGQEIAASKWITFLWTHRFPLRFYAPAVLPLLFASLVTATECVGGVAATIEASKLKTYGPLYEEAIQGSLLADGIGAFWAALATSIPLTTYVHNNGIITLSRCASRRAGYWCCFWLLVIGAWAKFAAVTISIPNCVVGAIMTCLLANVVVSGTHILNSNEGLNRRNRFIATLAIGIGLGVNLVPAWVNISGQANYPREGNFWPVNPNWSSSYRGFRDALILFISSGFSVGGFTAFFLNLILPFEKEEVIDEMVEGTEEKAS